MHIGRNPHMDLLWHPFRREVMRLKALFGKEEEGEEILNENADVFMTRNSIMAKTRD
jgi:hypothetical protein